MENPIQDTQQLVFAIARPETELSELLKETFDLAKKEPKVCAYINRDQDAGCKEKKKGRLEDKNWNEKKLTPFPGLEVEGETKIEANDLTLEQTKNRMQPIVVLMFLSLRAFLGGIKSKSTKLFIKESITIQNFFFENHLKFPGWNTISDNINMVTNGTLSFILDSQIRKVLEEGLDDFLELTIDSTDVSGNTVWPTDSGIILGLVARIWNSGQKLNMFGLPDMRTRRFPNIVTLLKKYHTEISLLGGKKGDKKRRKQKYGKILKEARKALQAFLLEVTIIEQAVSDVDILPSKKIQLVRIVELISDDIIKLEKVIDYCDQRVNHDKKIKSTAKIMSLADDSAAYISKGQREETIGYKPQLGRSKKGFITGINVPEGNVADSKQLEPMVGQHIVRTTVTPKVVSVDDGYASADGKRKVEAKGVEVVSISGSKGKKITLENDWESDLFKKARNDRSSVESLMFTLKYNYSFGQVMRRGIDNVRSEMLERVIVYNFCRIIEIRKRMVEKNPVATAS